MVKLNLQLTSSKKNPSKPETAVWIPILHPETNRPASGRYGETVNVYIKFPNTLKSNPKIMMVLRSLVRSMYCPQTTALMMPKNNE